MVVSGFGFVAVCALVGALGIDVLARVIKAGIAAEVIASIGIGLALLLVFRVQDLAVLTESLGAEASSGGSVDAGLLAALASGGGSSSGSTRASARPRKRGRPHARCLARSGSACSVSGCW